VTATQTTNSTDSSAAVPTLQTPSLAAATRTTVAARVTRTVQSAAAQTATPNPTPEDETPTAPNTADRIIQIGLMAAAIIGLGLILWGTLSRRSQ